MTNAASAVSTSVRTLYRLGKVEPTADGMRQAVDEAKLAGIHGRVESTTIDDTFALVAHGLFHNPAPDWCYELDELTRLAVQYESSRGGALLIFSVDATVYAISYGEGWRLLLDSLKDRSFGLRLAVRTIDPDQVKNLVRRTPGARGRIDSTYVTESLPIAFFGMHKQAEIVRRISGRLLTIGLTCEAGGYNVTLEGSAGVKARFGGTPDSLAHDIRTIAWICENTKPHPELEFIEQIQPIADHTIETDLDAALDTVLGWDDEDTVASWLSLSVPVSCIDHIGDMRSATVKVGANRLTEDLTLHDVLCRTESHRDGTRVQALRQGQIQMNRDRDGNEPLGSTAAIRWIEAKIQLGDREFFLLDGEWYEIGADYAASVRTEVSELLAGSPSLALPAWESGRDERWYNDSVPTMTRGSFVNLDRKLVGSQLHRRGIEMCDLLGPGDELIHVKRAESSSPLSHLFAQGLVATESLLHDSDAKSRFLDRVNSLNSARALPGDFRPRKLVFAILLKRGRPLTVDTLFTFSQVTLMNTARALRSQGVVVEVIGIEACD